MLFTGRIKDLLPKDSLDYHAHLLLVNALYFKGQWELQFDKSFTQEGVFYLNDVGSRIIPVASSFLLLLFLWRTNRTLRKFT